MESFKGYRDYRRREFCRDTGCPVQLELDARKEGSKEYEDIRKTCKQGCKHTAYNFHHWLIEKGFCVIKPED